MDKERQQRIYELLKRGLRLAESGEELPAEWARQLFPPERREYELVYGGKETEEQILADTMAVPLQPVSTFGQNGADWHNQLIFGDNLQAMKTLLQMKERGELVNADGTPGVKLIYIDPPFATKKDFRGSQDQKAYQDKIAGAEFLEFLRKRLVLLRELLSNDGSIYVHLDWRKGSYVKIILDEIFGEHRFQSEVVWQRHDPHNDAVKRYGRIHDVIYWYTKSATYIYNYNDITDILSENALKEYSLALLETGEVVEWHEGLAGRYRRFKLDDCTVKGNAKSRQFDWRGAKSSRKRVWPAASSRGMDQLVRQGIKYLRLGGRGTQPIPLLYLRNPGKGAKRCRVSFLDRREAVGQLAQDIWLRLGRMKGGSSYPNEKPELLLERVIRASSNDGDIVLDAFVGSGTTCAVAEKLNRRWIGIDCGKLAIYTTLRRMLNLRGEIGNSGKSLTPEPFTLYNAGLYDFETLRQLPWESWRFFALQLFECKDEPHKIHGFKMDGKRQGASVVVFNHFDKGTISRETISDIHASIGKAVGDRCFIIAPRGAFLFQEDFIEKQGTRYYALRIPYSYINELHRREFSALIQPSDETAVNETVEAVGFDFIQPPFVELEIGMKRGPVSVRIRKFESRARVRGEEEIRKHDALSMVMIDYDYNGKVFDLGKVLYADQLKANGWRIDFSKTDIKGNIMLVFLDIFGNESRRVIEQRSLMGNPRTTTKN